MLKITTYINMKEADVFPDIGWLDNNLFCGHGRADS